MIGFIFTILRSNAHYDYLINKKNDEGKSYWENRCIKENINKVDATPGAHWCEDSKGNFHIEKPSKFNWYFMFYSKKNYDFFIALFLWPVQLIGIDIINFRGLQDVF